MKRTWILWPLILLVFFVAQMTVVYAAGPLSKPTTTVTDAVRNPPIANLAYSSASQKQPAAPLNQTGANQNKQLTTSPTDQPMTSPTPSQINATALALARTSKPTATPCVTCTPCPTKTPKPTATPCVTCTPCPTKTPKPTATPPLIPEQTGPQSPEPTREAVNTIDVSPAPTVTLRFTPLPIVTAPKLPANPNMGDADIRPILLVVMALCGVGIAVLLHRPSKM